MKNLFYIVSKHKSYKIGNIHTVQIKLQIYKDLLKYFSHFLRGRHDINKKEVLAPKIVSNWVLQRVSVRYALPPSSDPPDQPGCWTSPGHAAGFLPGRRFPSKILFVKTKHKITKLFKKQKNSIWKMHNGGRNASHSKIIKWLIVRIKTFAEFQQF